MPRMFSTRLPVSESQNPHDGGLPPSPADRGPLHGRSTAKRAWMIALLWTMVLLAPGAIQAREFGDYDVQVQPAEVFPDADRFDPLSGTPKNAIAYKNDKPVGHVFQTSDIGYSGKPIEILAGVSKEGIITGAKVVKHAEPILLIGIPEQKLFDFVSRYVGRDPIKEAETAGKQAIDAISGATVTAIVINDGILRSARKIARGGQAETQTVKTTLIEPPFKAADWNSLLGDGSVRRMTLNHGDVDSAFAKLGAPSGEPYVKVMPPETLFIDLHIALVTPEAIGRNLLGEAEYANMREWLAPGQQALLIVANGSYSFRGSGFVRGGIFDRFKINQDGSSILLHDYQYRRLRDLGPDMPGFEEIGLFKMPENFDPTHPWALELLAQRPTGPIEKIFTSFLVSYNLPERFIQRQAIAPASTPVAQATAATDDGTPPLWQRIWKDRTSDVIVLAVSLIFLTMIFFFQELLVTHPRLVAWLRRGFLLFSVLFIGGYAQAQLSVVNVFTFLHALMGGFRWEFFLIDPLIFILWSATALSLLFWGRGAFCGWLCPFGALTELLNWVARSLGVPQFRIPFAWHERLWALKYVLFLGLLAVSLSSMAMAERLAEIEPFKTVVLLRFDREWPFVLYALILIGLGLFVERFFCRYLCPLGAAIAIPGRMRIFAWLKRRRQCGDLCSNCGTECFVQAILPNGEIHPNECFYCLHCQLNYVNENVCPTLIMRKNRRERRAAASENEDSAS
ncbi:Ion-translocating oxidoreductase complex subunit G [Candidatus Magnetaquicoccaceae bacterium FCR-1]|uniref:Ion-translocating oxidoreductase complex subunit G n=2 Tax=Candidatus Magnetaquiglobus chichijimensis TaxID=3141448 RepID=A0ABQ0CBL0_9PROT